MRSLLYYSALLLSTGLLTHGASIDFSGAKGGRGLNLLARQTQPSCLKPELIQDSSAITGQEPGTEGMQPGQTPSATDKYNFINFCDGQELTNGKALTTASCNGIPMGKLPAASNMISALITSPKHAARIPAETTFNISVQTSHLSAGHFVNPSTSYYTAPQDLDSNGDILGHCHITVQDIGSLDSVVPPDPNQFVYFAGILDNGDGHGLFQATVQGGLPPGAYRVCTMIAAQNHQPVAMPVAQRGAQDDCTKFEVVGYYPEEGEEGDHRPSLPGNHTIGKKCRRNARE
ncbi:hypothetical protein jhhlp_007483 [Lomentospora prolificans]|uniref:Uncharacterized protein n=1 Tax=Lomentospora prolificans TaxID=41688 RepID=A0A2N3N152_9PEZI|nr:hypothetical protein jhhlp_007483 [Lomentospora prolificans]